ncbi:MAG: hypothetical protein IJ091_03535 [Oscillospiraceae bacterium]|nr:hypothetical protein [Oscillospiraceae bacterium]
MNTCIGDSRHSLQRRVIRQVQKKEESLPKAIEKADTDIVALADGELIV